MPWVADGTTSAAPNQVPLLRSSLRGGLANLVPARRRAFCQGFCRLSDLKLASLDGALAGGASPAENSRFPQRTAPFSSLLVQQKRPYFLDRQYTETVRGEGFICVSIHGLGCMVGSCSRGPSR